MELVQFESEIKRVLENIPIPAGSRVPELTHMIDFLARAEIRRDLDEAFDRLRQAIAPPEGLAILNHRSSNTP